jgi:hypothetical protein
LGDQVTALLQGQVDACLEGDRDYVEAARWWLEECRRRVLDDVVSAALADEPAALCSIAVLADRAEDFSEQRWKESLEGLGRRPTGATVMGFRKGADTGIVEATATVWSYRHDPRWVSFSLEMRVATTDGTVPLWHQLAFRKLVTEFASVVDPVFGNITDDNIGLGTVLDFALPRSLDSLRHGREALRGYSWVTVVPAELVTRLGGARKLEASRAFAQVRPVSRGAVVLQATEAFEEYDASAAREVFLALAPVLPKGLPRSLGDGPRRNRLVLEDADDHCEGAEQRRLASALGRAVDAADVVAFLREQFPDLDLSLPREGDGPGAVHVAVSNGFLHGAFLPALAAEDSEVVAHCYLVAERLLDSPDPVVVDAVEQRVVPALLSRETWLAETVRLAGPLFRRATRGALVRRELERREIRAPR